MKGSGKPNVDGGNRVHRIMSSIARGLAIFGGAVLVTLVALTCLSVVGRILNSIGHSAFFTSTTPTIGDVFKRFGPINGDYELIEAGIALAIFLFLPWCQLNRGHATVELLTSLIPKAANRLLDLVWEVVFALAMLLITWRIFVGMSDKMRYGETTFLLQMPVWWAFSACTIAAFFASLVCVYSVSLRLTDFVNGQDAADAQKGVEH